MTQRPAFDKLLQKHTACQDQPSAFQCCTLAISIALSACQKVKVKP